VRSRRGRHKLVETDNDDGIATFRDGPDRPTSTKAEVFMEAVKNSLVVATFCSYDPILGRHACPGSGVAGLSTSSSAQLRLEGRDWPLFAHTMVDWLRLDNLHRSAETALHDPVEGDFMEAGVWRGGNTPAVDSPLLDEVLRCLERNVPLGACSF
jgi:hypothetical protein